MNYEYQIAEIRVLLDLPFKISVQRSSEMFLAEIMDQSPDVRFVCQSAFRLPEPSGNGYEEGNRCYVETESEKQVFFRPSPDDEPYACVTWRSARPDLLCCDYLPGQESRLNYSGNICDLLGLESLLLQFNCLLLHAAFICWQGYGILFSTDSGVGKSTQADLWVKYEGAEILNGDRAGLRKKDGVWTTYGLPYAGSSRVYRNESAPVTVILMLEQAPVNELMFLTPAQALRKLYPQITIHSWDAVFVQKALELIEDLVRSVPVFLLKCRPDEGAVEIVKDNLQQLFPDNVDRLKIHLTGKEP